MSSSVATTSAEFDLLERQWLEAWPRALAVWSRFTRLRPPRLCRTGDELLREGLTGSFAMIRLNDQAVIIDLSGVRARGLEEYAVEILAHEIGHHVLAPASLTEHARLLARMRPALPTLERHAPMVANLYTDLLINNRLQRSEGLRMAEVYRTLATRDDPGGVVWALYLRIYELLWSLERGSLGGGRTDDRLEGDAWLGARLLRSYARDWLEGGGRFAALLLPHLLEDEASAARFESWFDTRDAGLGGCPDGLVSEEPGERAGAIHPATDPDLAGEEEEKRAEAPPADPPEEEGASVHQQSSGQAREPFQYGEILRAAGINLSDHEVAVRYYRERALPWLVPFPKRRQPESVDPLPEGLEPWEIGDPPDAADWFQSVLVSPKVIPGMTTVQRIWGTTEGALPRSKPLDLDLYVDSSGSMPNPQRSTSYPALAGAILCLSALRAGARVQATLWSGKCEVMTTDGFVRDESAILRVLTGHFGRGTQFPIPVLRETYRHRRPTDPAAHILVISDDGVSTMFDKDEQGTSGWEVAAMALERARGGGTLVLQLPNDWTAAGAQEGTWPWALERARNDLGWHVHRVNTMEELTAFAREFSRRRFGPDIEPGGVSSGSAGSGRGS